MSKLDPNHKIYDVVARYLAQFGMNTNNPDGELYPKDDFLESIKLETPQDYRKLGEVCVFPCNGNNFKRFEISLAGTLWSRLTSGSDVQDKFEMAKSGLLAAIAEAGLNPVSVTAQNTVAGYYPEGADKAKMLDKLVAALEKKIERLESGQDIIQSDQRAR